MLSSMLSRIAAVGTRSPLGQKLVILRGTRTQSSVLKRFNSSNATKLRTRWKEHLAQLDALFLTGMTKFHEITGYSEIEKMKQELLSLEDQVTSMRVQVKEAREKYNEKLSKRSSSQHEMNELLMRKQTWLPEDLDRFTELYKNDHQIQRDVLESKAKYEEVESELENLQQQAAKLIGARYREEQLWSDRIRQASTWGTWVLMGINVVLFIVVQLVLEPWKRRRLVRSFESKVQDMLNEHQLQGLSPQNMKPLNMKQLAEHKEAAIEPDAALEHDIPRSDEDHLEWSSLLARLRPREDGSLPAIIQLRPIEAVTLSLGTGLALAGTAVALARVLT